MIEVLGEQYFIDLESIDKVVNIKNSTVESSDESEQTINLVSFEVVKMLLEIVMTEREEFDENLGTYSMTKLSIPFRIAFNTLLKHEILKHF
jgi:transcription termination factor NusB